MIDDNTPARRRRRVIAAEIAALLLVVSALFFLVGRPIYQKLSVAFSAREKVLNASGIYTLPRPPAKGSYSVITSNGQRFSPDIRNGKIRLKAPRNFLTVQSYLKGPENRLLFSSQEIVSRDGLKENAATAGAEAVTDLLFKSAAGQKVIYATRRGEVIAGRTAQRLVISADNVTVKNSKFGGSKRAAIEIAKGVTGTFISRTIIDGRGKSRVGISGSNFTISRSTIQNTVDCAIRAGGKISVSESVLNGTGGGTALTLLKKATADLLHSLIIADGQQPAIAVQGSGVTLGLRGNALQSQSPAFACYQGELESSDNSFAKVEDLTLAEECPNLTAKERGNFLEGIEITPVPVLEPTEPPTPESTADPKATPTETAQESLTPTTSVTPTPTGTFSISVTPTSTITATSSVTASSTATVTASPSLTASLTPTATRTITVTATHTLTSSPTSSATATLTATPSRTATPSLSPTFTATLTATASATATPTVSATPTPSRTRTPTITATFTPSYSPTFTPSRTSTATATATSSPSVTITLTPTRTRTATPTRTATTTVTSSPTSTATATLTATSSRTATPSLSPTFTATLTPTRTPTATGTFTRSPTPTATPVTYPFPASCGSDPSCFNTTGNPEPCILIVDTDFHKIAQDANQSPLSYCSKNNSSGLCTFKNAAGAKISCTTKSVNPLQAAIDLASSNNRAEASPRNRYEVFLEPGNHALGVTLSSGTVSCGGKTVYQEAALPFARQVTDSSGATKTIRNTYMDKPFGVMVPSYTSINGVKSGSSWLSTVYMSQAARDRADCTAISGGGTSYRGGVGTSIFALTNVTDIMPPGTGSYAALAGSTTEQRKAYARTLAERSLKEPVTDVSIRNIRFIGVDGPQNLVQSVTQSYRDACFNTTGPESSWYPCARNGMCVGYVDQGGVYREPCMYRYTTNYAIKAMGTGENVEISSNRVETIPAYLSMTYYFNETVGRYENNTWINDDQAPSFTLLTKGRSGNPVKINNNSFSDATGADSVLLAGHYIDFKGNTISNGYNNELGDQSAVTVMWDSSNVVVEGNRIFNYSGGINFEGYWPYPGHYFDAAMIERIRNSGRIAKNNVLRNNTIEDSFGCIGIQRQDNITVTENTCTGPSQRRLEHRLKTYNSQDLPQQRSIDYQNLLPVFAKLAGTTGSNSPSLNDFKAASQGQAGNAFSLRESINSNFTNNRITGYGRGFKFQDMGSISGGFRNNTIASNVFYFDANRANFETLSAGTAQSGTYDTLFWWPGATAPVEATANIYQFRCREKSAAGTECGFVAGFDPGFTKALITTGNPDSPETRDAAYRGRVYYENCPDAPGGRCKGTLPAGGGFYNLFDNESCILNRPDLRYNESSTNMNVPCPFFFNWKRGGGGALISNLKIDSRNFVSIQGKNDYLGLQTNFPYGAAPFNLSSSYHGGINLSNPAHAPLIRDMDRAEFKIRAKFCGQPSADSHRFMRIIYYFGWLSPSQGNKGNTISVNLLTYFKPSMPGFFPSPVARETDMSGMSPTDPLWDAYYRHIHIDATTYDVILENGDLMYDTTSDCSTAIENAPWISVTVPIASIIAQLKNEGYLDNAALADGKYSGGILAGIESWGRMVTELDMKSHTLYLK